MSYGRVVAEGRWFVVFLVETCSYESIATVCHQQKVLIGGMKVSS